MKTFVESQFSYCLLIWMFHSRRLNNKINIVHEKARGTICSDYKATFHELLGKGASFSVHPDLSNRIYSSKSLGFNSRKDKKMFLLGSFEL